MKLLLYSQQSLCSFLYLIESQISPYHDILSLIGSDKQEVRDVLQRAWHPRLSEGEAKPKDGCACGISEVFRTQRISRISGATVKWRTSCIKKDTVLSRPPKAVEAARLWKDWSNPFIEGCCQFQVGSRARQGSASSLGCSTSCPAPRAYWLADLMMLKVSIVDKDDAGSLWAA